MRLIQFKRCLSDPKLGKVGDLGICNCKNYNFVKGSHGDIIRRIMLKKT